MNFSQGTNKTTVNPSLNITQLLNVNLLQWAFDGHEHTTTE